MSRTERPRINMFVIPVLAVAGIVLAALAVANQAWISAAIILASTVGVGLALVVLSRRSDTVAMLGDDVHEERNVHIHRRASIVTLNIVAAVVIVAGLVFAAVSRSRRRQESE